MGIEIDLILRLRYEFLKNQEHYQKNDKKKVDAFYYLLEELEKNLKNLSKNNL